MEQKKNGKSIASLVLGIVSVVFWFFGIGAIVSLVTGIIGLVLAIQVKKAGESSGMNTAGFIL